jgi:peptidoglycan/LPS O-acetylase OafA/YrhL
MKYVINQGKLGHRRDIDGLRAIAVVLVVIGHFFPRTLPKGFLGVDMFFVISGFVISQLLMNMEKSSSSKFLFEFYAKRLRRLLPALLTVVTITFALTFLLVTRINDGIANTGAYSILGISNMYLWHLASDYFGIAASQNPFTHTWSLGVEEQFYFLYPLLFLIIWKASRTGFRRIMFGTIATATIASLSLSFIWADSKSNLVFYSMPTRLWQLGFGALSFFLLEKKSISNARNTQLRVVAICVFLAGILLPLNIIAIPQLLVCVSTAIMLVSAQEDVISRFFSSQFLCWIGIRSYSIYLIHWPLLVLTNYLLGSDFVKNLVCLPITLILSSVMYNKIENPFRVGKFRINAIKTLAIGLPIIFVSSFIFYFMGPKLSLLSNNILPNLFGVSDVPDWIPTPCSGSENISKLKDPIDHCLGRLSTSQKKFVYLIGDSHADHLIAMVRKSFDSTAYEFRNLNIENGIDFPFGEFNANNHSASLNFLRNNAKNGDIVILSFHRGHLNPARDSHISLSKKIQITEPTLNLIDNLTSFSRDVSRLGVKIILVKDTPLMRSIQTSQSCALQLKLLGRDGCAVTKSQDSHTRYLQSYAFDNVVKLNTNVMTWDPYEYVYSQSSVFNVLGMDGSYNMWDWNHITQKYSDGLSPSFLKSISLFIKER